VSLLRIETRTGQRDEHWLKLVHSTFLLAAAIHWATSYHTSAKHIEEYEKAIKGYLEVLKELQPTKRYHPNHINALLVGRYICLYGPVQGWWMFLFERAIGDLQRSSTNNKPGE